MEWLINRLVVLGPVLRPLIELHWTRDVARRTRIPMEDETLRMHLFGSERIAFDRTFVDDLSQPQNGDCFYCGDRLGGRREVDHFLAWSRGPNDAIENLVIADQYNNAKSDYLAATEHLVRWRLRLETRTDDLTAIGSRHRLLTSADRTRALVFTTYSHIAPGTPLWLRGKEFEFATGPLLG